MRNGFSEKKKSISSSSTKSLRKIKPKSKIELKLTKRFIIKRDRSLRQLNNDLSQIEENIERKSTMEIVEKYGYTMSPKS